MDRYNQKVGEYGEMLAEKYLVKKGYHILAKNIKVGRQEIDILCKIRDFYIFVEVKCRASATYGLPEDSLSHSKFNQLKFGIAKYIGMNKIPADKIRVDLVAVEINKTNKTANIRHYKDIL